MKIGSIDLGERPVFLAPMEDVTDISFRLMCKSFGADMVYTEFVSSDALIRSVNKTQQKLNVSDDERPVAIQIYGKDVASMVEAARICEEARPDILDINFGCRKESSRQGSRGRYATQYPVDAGNHERSSESREHPRHRENPFRMGCRQPCYRGSGRATTGLRYRRPLHPRTYTGANVHGRGGLDLDRCRKK